MVGQAQIVHRKIADGGEVGDKQIKSVASGVCWAIGMWSEVEAVKKFYCYYYKSCDSNRLASSSEL